MSKMDDMRAMREARYAAAQTGRAEPAVVPRVTAPKTTAPVRAARTKVVPEPSSDELCGHRAISGRTCTREKGHAAKSHRYS